MVCALALGAQVLVPFPEAAVKSWFNVMIVFRHV